MWLHNTRKAKLEKHTACTLSAYIGSVMFVQDHCQNGNLSQAESIIRQNLHGKLNLLISSQQYFPRYFFPQYK